MSTEFLCYRQAHWKNKAGKITEKEYFHHIFQHLIRSHDGDEEIHLELRDINALSYELNCMINTTDVLVTNATPFEDVFEAYRNGTSSDIDAKIACLHESYRDPMRKAVGLLALQERNMVVLKPIIENWPGYFSEAFEDEAFCVKRERDSSLETAETWKVLRNSPHFREPEHWKWKKSKTSKIHPSR